MICKPTGAGEKSDVFAFGAHDAGLQTLRNLAVLISLPWAAAWAVGAEMTVESLRRAGF